MTNSKLTRRGVIGGVAATVGFAAAAIPGDAVGQEGGTLDDPVLIEYFLEVSAVVTAFSRADLQATEQSFIYFNTVRDVVGNQTFADFLNAYHNRGLEAVLTSPKYGPIARNIVKLWYGGTWERLPSEWREAYGAPPNDTTFMVSADAYTAGLLWTAIGVNPPGANAPGYGTWSDPPKRY